MYINQRNLYKNKSYIYLKQQTSNSRLPHTIGNVQTDILNNKVALLRCKFKHFVSMVILSFRNGYK